MEVRPTVKIGLEGSKGGGPWHVPAQFPPRDRRITAAAGEPASKRRLRASCPELAGSASGTRYMGTEGSKLCFTPKAQQHTCAISPQGCWGPVAHYHAICRVSGRSDAAENARHHVEEATLPGSDGQEEGRPPNAPGGHRVSGVRHEL